MTTMTLPLEEWTEAELRALAPPSRLSVSQWAAKHVIIKQGPKTGPFDPRFAPQLNEIMDSFSGHADQSELHDYFDAMTGPREKVWLVHGEPRQSAALCEALREKGTAGSVEVAELNQEVEF